MPGLLLYTMTSEETFKQAEEMSQHKSKHASQLVNDFDKETQQRDPMLSASS